MTANLQPIWNNPTFMKPLPEVVLALPIKKGYELVKENNILYCKAEGNYTQIFFLDNHNLLISRQLGEMEASLKSAWFLRVHQSYIVNVCYAQQYIRQSGGQIVMQGGSVLPVSKNQKNQLLNLFNFV